METSSLKSIGLSKSEISVYLFLLENGAASSPTVSRGTKIARTNCYHVLNSLLTKGLLTTKYSKNKKIYIANDPEELIHFSESKTLAVKKLIPTLKALKTPRLNSIMSKHCTQPEEIKEVLLQALSAKKIFSTNLPLFFNSLPLDFYTYFQTEIESRGIELIEIPFSNEKTPILPFSTPEAAIFSWNDSIFSITKKWGIEGFLIVEKQLALAYQAIFTLASIK